MTLRVRVVNSKENAPSARSLETVHEVDSPLKDINTGSMQAKLSKHETVASAYFYALRHNVNLYVNCSIAITQIHFFV